MQIALCTKATLPQFLHSNNVY